MEQEYVNTMMMGINNLKEEALKRQYNIFFGHLNNKSEINH